MSELSKQALRVDNNQSFPNNNNGAITPSVLRAFNVNMIDSNVNQTDFDTFSGSVASEFASLTASVDPSITGSSLITASISGQTMTFTKGDNTTFNVTLPAGSGSVIDTGSFATTGSNTFTGNQNISGSIFFPNGAEIRGTAGQQTVIASNTNLQINPATSMGINAGTTVGISGSNVFLQNLRYPNFDGTAGQVITTDGAGILTFATVSGSGGGTTGATLGANTFTGSQTISQSVGLTSLTLQGSETSLDLSGSNSYIRQNGVLWFRNQFGPTGFRETNFVTRNNRINFGADDGFYFGRTDGVDGVRTSSGGVKMNTVSGSLILSAAQYSVTTGSLLHLSCSSDRTFVNLVFKSNDNTADTIISGSNNIFQNPTAATAGFKRYIGSNNIFSQGGFVPQISASMQFSPTINGNIGGIYNIRGPISASIMQMNNNISANGVIQIGIPGNAVQNAERLTGATSVSANIVAGTLTLVGNVSEISGTITINQNSVNGLATLNANQSAITFNNNIVNDSSFILTNNYFSSSAGIGSVALNRNNIAGQGNQIIITGSQPAGTTNPTSYSDNFIGGGLNTLFANVATARVSGSIAYHSAIRNMIFGNNLIVSASSLLTDAASNGSAFFGRWNSINGNSDLTAETIFAVGTGTSTTTRKTGFLIDSGSNTFVEGTLNVSGSLTIQSGSTFFANGNRQFNVGAFQSGVTQSGSANVSQSMNFETTDISSGVSIASNSRITLANSGTYNIQFSAQTQATGGADNLYIWLKKNGTNVNGSAGNVEIANNAEIIAAWNYVVDAAAGDYFELAWQAGNIGTILLAAGASGNIPSIPSVILTVTQVR